VTRSGPEELVARARAEGVELVGPGGLLTDLTKTVLETAPEVEMDDHLGYAKQAPDGRDEGNSRNGSRSKTVLTEVCGREREPPAPTREGDELAGCLPSGCIDTAGFLAVAEDLTDLLSRRVRDVRAVAEAQHELRVLARAADRLCEPGAQSLDLAGWFRNDAARPCAQARSRTRSMAWPPASHACGESSPVPSTPRREPSASLRSFAARDRRFRRGTFVNAGAPQ